MSNKIGKSFTLLIDFWRHMISVGNIIFQLFIKLFLGGSFFVKTFLFLGADLGHLFCLFYWVTADALFFLLFLEWPVPDVRRTCIHHPFSLSKITSPSLPRLTHKLTNPHHQRCSSGNVSFYISYKESYIDYLLSAPYLSVYFSGRHGAAFMNLVVLRKPQRGISDLTSMTLAAFANSHHPLNRFKIVTGGATLPELLFGRSPTKGSSLTSCIIRNFEKVSL